MNDKLNKLYNQLISTGYRADSIGADVDAFRQNLQDPAKRDKLYNQLINTGYQRSAIGNDATEFSDRLGMRTVNADGEDVGLTPMQKAGYIAGARRIASSANSMPDLGGGDATSRVFGTAVPRGVTYDSEEGRLRQQYSTPTGTVEDRDSAQRTAFKYRDSRFNGTIEGQLRSAQQRYGDVQQRMAERLAVLEEEHQNNRKGGLLRSAADIMAGDRLGGYQGENPDSWAEVVADKEYQALRLQANTLQKEMQGLRNARDKEVHGDDYWYDQHAFLRNAGQAVTDASNWDFGMSALRDAATMAEINRDSDIGGASEEQKNAMEELALLQSVNVYANDDSAWAGWGTTAGMMPGFMKDFILTGGFSGITTQLPTKAAVKVAERMATKKIANNLGKKVAEEGLTRFLTRYGREGMSKLLAEQGVSGVASILTTKALGVGAEELLLRAPAMSATVQGMTTLANVQKEKLGQVKADDKGNLVFANDKTWSEAAWESAADQVVENYSEMWGAHLPGVSDALRAFGARNLTAAVLKATREGAGTVLSKVNKFMASAGVNGYFGEVGEEYYGQLWRTMLGLQSAYDNDGNNLLNDPKFHGDIWAGLALSIGMTGSATLGVTYTADKGLDAAQYLANRHQVSVADRIASAMFSEQYWKELKTIIDATSNEQVGDMIEGLVKDKDLSDRQRGAILNYTGALLQMRGHNLGEMLRRKSGEEPSAVSTEQSDNYRDGYSATNADERLSVRQRLDLQRQKVAQVLGISPDAVDDYVGDDLVQFVNDAEQTYTGTDMNVIRDYADAVRTYDGMVQRIRDDIETRQAELTSSVNERVNTSDNMIHPATLQDGREVYILRGNVAMTEDGSGVDTAKSDDSIVVVDPMTGKKEMISPSAFKTVDAPMIPEEVRQQAREDAANEIADKASREIDGDVDLTPGSQYTIRDDHGDSQIEIQAYDPATNVVSVAMNGVLMQLTPEQIQDGVDRYREETFAEKAAEEDAEQLEEEIEEPMPEPTAAERIPKDEEGGLMYEEAEPEVAYDALLEETEGDEQMAADVLADIIRDKEAALKTARETEPGEAATPAEKIAERKRLKQAVEDAERALAQWNSIAAVAQKRRDKDAEQQRLDAEKYPAQTNADGFLSDKDGNAVTFYHGTPADITSADQLEPGHRRPDGDKAQFNGNGISFTPDITVATDYADGGNVLPAQLKLAHPYVVYGRTYKNEAEAIQFSDSLKQQGYDGIVIYASQAMRDENTLPIEVVVFDKSSVVPVQITEKSSTNVAEDGGNMAETAQKDIETAREQTDTNPTEAQKAAGNYRKGKVQIDGMTIAIENPKGSTRSGKDADGKEWSVKMNFDYGYILRTESVDGDHIDIYLSQNPEGGKVFVVDQVNQKTGEFDEHKVMYGFDSMEEAVAAYKSQYEEGWKVGPVTEVSKEEFARWLNSSKKKGKPFSEYANIKHDNEQPSEIPAPFSPGLVRDSYTRKNTNEELLDTIAKMLGVSVQFVDSVSGGKANANIVGNVVLVEKKNRNPIKFLIGHEFTHRMQDLAPEQYKKFMASAKSAMGIKKFYERVEHLREVYANANVPITDAKLEDEVTADYAGSLVYNYDAFERYLQSTPTKPTLWRKILDVLKSIVEFFDSFNDPVATEYKKRINKSIDMFEELLKASESSMNDDFKVGENAAETAEGIKGGTAEERETAFSIKEVENLENKSNRFYENYHVKGKKSSMSPIAKTVTKEQLDKGSRDIREMSEIMKPYLDVTMYGKRVLPEEIYGKGLSTIWGNGSYGRTMENTLTCLRTLAYNDFVDNVKRQIKRPLLASESFLASQMLYDIATDPQCLYCYVSIDRKAYDEYMLTYLRDRDAVIAKYDALPEKTPEAEARLYEEFLNKRKDTKNMRSRFKMWINTKKEDLVRAKDLITSEKREELKENGKAIVARQIKDIERYAQSASWAKRNTVYRAYNGELLNMGQNVLNMLNSAYGLRFYSFSEYSPAFIVENMQMVRDAALKGLKGLAYTKEIDFAKIFAPTGININVSVYARIDKNGKVVADERQGASWEEAKKLREQYPNVGIVMVVTNDDMVDWALSQEWTDVVIPFHMTKGSEAVKVYGYTNYTSKQADRDSKGRAMDIMPNEHDNNKERFLQLAKERGLTPRFEQFIYHPNYMKLVNETRRSASQTQPIVPVFDLEAAKESWNAFIEKGGYYGGWYQVDQEGYDAAVQTVVDDIRAGKTTKDVDYGRQDVPIDEEATMRTRRKLHGHHGNVPLTSVPKVKGEERKSIKDDTETEQIIADAKANGTYLLAPNGKKTNLSPEQWVQVRTKAFKDWFGDWENDAENASKVVDENGEPKVVYHGTDKIFTKFDSNAPHRNNENTPKGAFFFSSSEEAAISYGDPDEGRGYTMPVFLNIKNPDIETDYGWLNWNGKVGDGFALMNKKTKEPFRNDSGRIVYWSDEEVQEALDKAGESMEDYDKVIKFDEVKFFPTTNALVRDNLTENGGVIIHNVHDVGENVSWYFDNEDEAYTTTDYIIGNPNNAKSATDNNGDFSKTNNDIRYSIKEDQYDIIQNANPMTDDVHTGIRSVDDILSFDEAMANESYTPDYTAEDASEALQSGIIKVYSSKPIAEGVFVTPSKMEAQNYAGDGEVYEAEIPTSDVAWIDTVEGQYAPSMLGAEIRQDEGEAKNVRYSIREEPAPKKTGKGYKVFFLKNGKLYPPMVANPEGEDTPVNVWLNADAAPIAGTTKTGRNQVKAGGKGTQGGSGSTLSYRPGWHLGEIPYALQFNRGEKIDNPLGIKTQGGKVLQVRRYFPNNFVWAEVEYSQDNNYQKEAESYGYNNAGNFQHSLAGLPRIPKDGYYMYRTNPNPATDPWIITGAMKVTKILTPTEVDDLVRSKGREPQEREEGAVTDEEVMALNKAIIDAEIEQIIAEAKANNTYLLAPNGEESNLNPEQWAQVRTKKFISWFGDWMTDPDNASKIRDENGEPKVLYHGTGNYGFTRFGKDDGDTPLDDAKWFTNDPVTAETFKIKGGSKGGVYAVFVNARNPYELDFEGDDWAGLGEHGLESTDYYAAIAEIDGKDSCILYNVKDIYGDNEPRVANQYIVYKPNQVKSATDNVGTFSKSNDDIRYSIKNPVGGNSGYVGYSMSKRAEQAREEGRYPRTDFRKEYNITAKSLDVLTDLGYIDDDEWHHTSVYGNKTTFYGWDDDVYMEAYQNNKKEIDALSRELTKPKDVIEERMREHMEGMFLWDRIKGNKYLTDDEVNERDRLQEEISASGKDWYDRKEEHEKVRLKYLDIANKREEKDRNAIKNSEEYKEYMKDVDSKIKRYNEWVSKKTSAEKRLREIMDTAENKGNNTRYSIKDTEYMDAVKNNDMDKVQQLVAEAAKAAGYLNDIDYRIMHQAPTSGYDNVTIDNITDMFPEDIFSNKGAYYYGDGNRYESQRVIDIMRDVQGNPDAMVTAYRAVPKDVKEGNFRNGDWVTISRDYAKEHGYRNFGGGNYNIIEQKVPAKYLYNDGNSIFEFGYDDEKNYGYKNTKNNRKLLDAVTYDDEGNVIPLSKRFKPRNPDARFSLKDEGHADVFYSNAAHAVESIKQNKATPEQWLKMIEKNGGLKAGEDKWLGLSDWLKNSDAKTLTKDEVLDYIKSNEIQIEETNYRQSVRVVNEHKKYVKDVNDYIKSFKDKEWNRNADNVNDLYEKFPNLSEMSEKGIIREKMTSRGLFFEISPRYVNPENGIKKISQTRLEYTTEGLRNKREIALTVPTIDSWNKQDSVHFGDAGEGRAVAWVRFGETTDEDGKRVLVIDEVQSKRHQEGREKGYTSQETLDKMNEEVISLKKIYDDAKYEYDRKREVHRALMEDEFGVTDMNIVKELMRGETQRAKQFAEGSEELKVLSKDVDEKYNAYTKALYKKKEYESSRVSDAPFDKNWSELVMKRMLRYAAENGYDKVAWTTGMQQAERYDIGGKVDEIMRTDEDDNDKYHFKIYLHNNANGFNLWTDAEGKLTYAEGLNGEWAGKHLSDVVGKDVAEKMLNLKPMLSLRGEDMTFGGSGMKAFYDKMIPSFMNKYVKKWGTKVTDVVLPELKEDDRVMHSVDVTPEMKESVMQGQPLFSLKAFDEYNADQRGFMERLREAAQDGMKSLQDLQNAISKETGMPIEGYQDAYMANNHMSSRNEAETQVYLRDFLNPLIEQAAVVAGGPKGMDELNDYLMAKHGLERNEVFRTRDAKRVADEWERKQLFEETRNLNFAKAKAARNINSTRNKLHEKMESGELDYDSFLNEIDEIKKANMIPVDEAQQILDAKRAAIKPEKDEIFENELAGLEGKDFSGLTEVTAKIKIKGNPDAGYEEKARHMVETYENEHDKEELAILWQRINAATNESLYKAMMSGTISRANYEYMRDRFHFYVPLRGWDNHEAAKEYEYFGTPSQLFAPAIHKAGGRTSKADNVLSYIAFNGQGAIREANRNLMLLHLLNLVEGHKTSLAQANRQWYVYDDISGEWKEEDFNPQDPVYHGNYEEWEAHMKQLQAEFKATQKPVKLDTGLHMRTQEKAEHQVPVMRAGEKWIININGNPRAAQAIKGMLKADNNDSKAYRTAMSIKNFMARMFTSQNPAFIISNGARDLIWASAAIAIKEGGEYHEYHRQYLKNIYGIVSHGKTFGLIRKFKNNTLDDKDETDRMFKEFIMNGGETGFTALNSVEDYKRNINRLVKDMHSGVNHFRKVWRAGADGVEFLNRGVEDMSRFAVYMTSRQMGRSIERSVHDAKEVTVNFNTKGSGEMYFKYANFAYIFFNAAVQSVSNFVKLAKNHKGEFATRIARYAVYGMALPMLAAGFGGDDDNTYFDLPKWVRENNLVFPIPLTSLFITIPLPHELRPFYAIGENLFCVMCGKEDVTHAFRNAALGFSSMLPLDFTGNSMNPVINFTPTILQPFVQIGMNTDFFGKPIYKKGDYIQNSPEWKKAFKGTSPILVNGTKAWNEKWGGDDVRSSKFILTDDGRIKKNPLHFLTDVNPAWIEHILESYFGGVGKTINKGINAGIQIAENIMEGKWEWQMRNTPVVSSFIQGADERTSGSSKMQEYYDLVDDYEEMEKLYNGYNREAMKGREEYDDKFDDLLGNDDFTDRYFLLKDYITQIRSLNSVKDFLPEADQTEIDKTVRELKEEMISEYHKLGSEGK